MDITIINKAPPRFFIKINSISQPLHCTYVELSTNHRSCNCTLLIALVLMELPLDICEMTLTSQNTHTKIIRTCTAKRVSDADKPSLISVLAASVLVGGLNWYLKCMILMSCQQ